MNSEQSIAAWSALGEFIRSGDDALQERMQRAYVNNKWLTHENINAALSAISSKYVQTEKLAQWLRNYPALPAANSRTIGVVAAGNIPLVAFHDVLSVLISGHSLQLKLSEKADVMLPFLLDRLCRIEPGYSDRIHIVERLKGFDAVIATGSSNSARYFEYYFSKVPRIIRKNRNSLAVLTGNETKAELKGLGSDVFSYFGLGCRNVSKLYLPAGYDLEHLVVAFEDFSYLSDHNLYRNNLDYNRTLLLLNSIPFLNIDFINVTQNPVLASPIANLHYEFYEDLEAIRTEISDMKDQVQCIAGHVDGLCDVPLGKTQEPELMDYADGVDTMEFLTKLPI